MNHSVEALTNAPTTIHAVSPPRERPVLDVSVIAKRAGLVRELRAIMRADVHYGKIPGTPKPTLYKPGAELISSLFRFSLEPVIEDVSTEGEVAYRVLMRATHGPSGVYLGAAAGICSTGEEKYRWRKPVCDEEWEEAEPDRRREVWKGGRNGAWKAKQVRQDPATIAQTILAMAVKRAMVSVVRQVSAASDLFTEGLEDLPDEARDAVMEGDPEHRGDERPKAKPQEYAGPSAKEIEEAIKAADTKAALITAQDMIRELPYAEDRKRLSALAYSRIQEVTDDA